MNILLEDLKPIVSDLKITQLSVEEKQTLKEIFSRSEPAKEHRKLRRRNPKL